MWILFGNKTRARPVPGGRAIERRCTECNQVRRFVECDVADTVSLFSVPVFEMKNRRMVCPDCGDDFEVSPAPDARPPNSVSAPPPAEKASPTQRPSERDLDKMLADLKKKMGR